MNSFLQLLLLAVTLIAGMFICYITAYEISTFRKSKRKKNLFLGILMLIMLAGGFLLTLLKTGGFISYALGILVGFMPFFHIKNSETDAQIKVTNRERELREKRYEEQKAKREAGK